MLIDFVFLCARMVNSLIPQWRQTFPKGGVWKGKNYVFDRRRAQVPAEKPDEDLKKEVESRCANPNCRVPWDEYRGRLKCCGEVPEGTCTAGSTRCGVPVMLCNKCFEDPSIDNSKQRCDLCLEGYVPPLARVQIDLQAQKRQVLGMGGKVIHKSHIKKKRPHDAMSAAVDESAVSAHTDTDADTVAKKMKKDKKKDKKDKKSKKKKKAEKEKKNNTGSDEAGLSNESNEAVRSTNVASEPVDNPVDGRRLFVKQLPFIVTAEEVRTAFGVAAGGGPNDVELIDWKRDVNTGLFYGAAFVLMVSKDAANRVLGSATLGGPGVVLGVTQGPLPAAPIGGAPKGGGKKKSKKGKGKAGGNSKKKLKVTLAPLRKGEVWPPPGFTEQPAPPVV